MQINLEPSSGRFRLRGIAPDGAVLVNDRALHCSFALDGERMIEPWRPQHVSELEATDIETLFALEPNLILLGTGALHRFPAPRIMAVGLGRGIGCEAMTNAAAARTFNALLAEGRRVVAAFLLPG